MSTFFSPSRVESEANATQRPGSFTVNGGVIPRRAVYPPVTTSFQVQGYVRDTIKPHDSRDIGRSSMVKDRPYYVFGDTFCKSFDGGDFLGAVSNSSAVIKDIQNPLKSTYVDLDEDKSEGLLKPFIPLTSAERAQERAGVARICLWSFGGVVTSEAQGHSKYLWFEKTVEHKDSNGTTTGTTSVGTGLALVDVDSESGGLRAWRVFGDDMLFGPNEPRVGVVSAVASNQSFFLWGHRGDDIILARVRDDVAHVKAAYAYWDGHQYVSDCGRAAPVLSGYQHGQFYRSNLFGPSKPWVFVGCTSYGDSKVMMAAARNIEGPWENMTAVCTGGGIDVPDKFIYCVYPHPWAYGEKTGELFLTWKPEQHWKEIDPQNERDDIVEWAEECDEIKQMVALKGVHMAITRTLPLGRAKLHLQGGDAVGVQEAQIEICRLLARRVTETTVGTATTSPPPPLAVQQPQQLAVQQPRPGLRTAIFQGLSDLVHPQHRPDDDAGRRRGA